MLSTTLILLSLVVFKSASKIIFISPSKIEIFLNRWYLCYVSLKIRLKQFIEYVQIKNPNIFDHFFKLKLIKYWNWVRIPLLPFLSTYPLNLKATICLTIQSLN